jgi:2-polyprenyl-3-methyl-5-hydroxy-6-metoxy-1,4-benzoquinol methylase
LQCFEKKRRYLYKQIAAARPLQSKSGALKDQRIGLCKVTLNMATSFFNKHKKHFGRGCVKMTKNDCTEIVKKEFDFGWKKSGSVQPVDPLTLEYQKGDVLDVGCGTCQLYNFLTQNGWAGRYIGIDAQPYEGYAYPAGVELVIGDALELTFPKTDTVVLGHILEHVEDPCALLSKSIESCRDNVILSVPKRNEALWKHGVVEWHQLDKTHKHCGFSKEEVTNIVCLSGGKIRTYKDFFEINATVGMSLWNSQIPQTVILVLSKIFSSKTFYADIWCEVVKE